MFTPILATITGDPMLDLFAVGLVGIILFLLVIGFVGDLIRTILNKLIFHNKKYK